MTSSTKQEPPPNFLPSPSSALTPSDVKVRLTMWLLSIEGAQPKRRFVHGNVLRSRSKRPAERWYRYQVVALPKKEKLLRYSVELDGPLLKVVLDEVASGSNLLDSLNRLGFCHEDFSESDLATTTLQPLPTAFFSGIPQVSGPPSHLWPRSSPVNNVGCFCDRYVRGDRMAFLPSDPVESEGLIRPLCAALGPETGLNFDKNAGDAFGSLEVYHFPSLDEDERPRVETTYRNQPHKTLHLRIHSPPDVGSFAVQVRSEQVRDTAADTLYVLDRSDAELDLDLPEPLDGALIRIWARANEDSPWQLWHEQENHFIREIGFNLSMGGLTGSVGASWLDGLKPGLQARVEKFKEIRQVSMDVPSETSTRLPWEKGIQNARKLVANAHIPASKARFFQRGWGAYENKFEFAEWLKEKLSSHDGTIVLADPYFDLLGLDLICRASGAAKELIVVTCTQVKSEDDTMTQSRAERLQEGARQYLPILAGLSLRINDLRSPSSETSTNQLFHDRYLLLLDANGNPKEGYNLSTSLQSAATSSPLLITEIAPDILPDVTDYVTSLLTPTEGEHRVQQIYPLNEQIHRASRELTETGAESLLAVAKASGREVGSRTATEQVKSLGLYKDDEVHFELSDDDLDHVVDYLVSAELAEAAQVWDGLVQIAASRWFGGVPDLIKRLNAHAKRDAVRAFLTTYLEAHGTGQLKNDDSSTYTRTLAQVLELPFEKVLGEAARFYDYHHEFPLGTSWGIRLALIATILDDPSNVDSLVQSLRAKKQYAMATFARTRHKKKEERPNSEELKAATRVSVNADAVLSAATSTLTWFSQGRGPGLNDAHAKSKEPFIRALWAVGHVRTATGTGPEGVVDPAPLQTKLALLNPEERRLVLGQAVYDLRIRANQTLGRSEERENLPTWLPHAIITEAPSPSGADELERLVKFYSGPLLGHWAVSTHNELVNPLVNAGKLSDDELFEVWDRVLARRMHDDHATRGDFEVLQVWGHCFWFTADGVRERVNSTDRNNLEGAQRTLEEPLLMSRNHDKWSKAVKAILWTLLRAWAIVRGQTPEHHDGTASEFLEKCREIAMNERLVGEALGEMKAMVEYVLVDLNKN